MQRSLEVSPGCMLNVPYMEGGLLVLFLDLGLSIASPPPRNFFADALVS